MKNKIIIFLITIITFTGIGIPKNTKAAVVECATYINICPSGQVNQDTGVCTGGTRRFCNKYKIDALKCSSYTKMTYVTKGQVPYQAKACRWAYQCKKNSGDVSCNSGEWAEKASSNTEGCASKWFGPYYEWECCHNETRYKEGFVIGQIDICTQWDINVQFGNTTIDPNLIEY